MAMVDGSRKKSVMSAFKTAFVAILLVYALVYTYPVGAQDTLECTVSAREMNTNKRSGPSTEFDVIGVIPAGQSAAANGQAIGFDGFVWWHLPEGAWVRIDAVAAANCETLPEVDPTTGDFIIVPPFEIGDERITTGAGPLLLIFAEPRTDAEIVLIVLHDVQLTVVSGPETVDGKIWWQVQSADGEEGWVRQHVLVEASTPIPAD